MNSLLFSCSETWGGLNLDQTGMCHRHLKFTPLSWSGKTQKVYNYMYCIVLCCITLHCIALHYIVLYCIVLYCIVLYCIVLYCIVLYCIVLYCIALDCIVLYCIVLYCIVDKDHIFALLIRSDDSTIPL